MSSVCSTVHCCRRSPGAAFATSTLSSRICATRLSMICLLHCAVLHLVLWNELRSFLHHLRNKNTNGLFNDALLNSFSRHRRNRSVAQLILVVLDHIFVAGELTNQHLGLVLHLVGTLAAILLAVSRNLFRLGHIHHLIDHRKYHRDINALAAQRQGDQLHVELGSCWSCSFFTSRKSALLPAVGPLFSPAAGPLFSPAVGPSTIHHVVLDLGLLCLDVDNLTLFSALCWACRFSVSCRSLCSFALLLALLGSFLRTLVHVLSVPSRFFWSLVLSPHAVSRASARSFTCLRVVWWFPAPLFPLPCAARGGRWLQSSAALVCHDIAVHPRTRLRESLNMSESMLFFCLVC